MISSISSSMASSMQITKNSGTQGAPPAKGKDVFQVADTNGDGVVSQTELDALAQGIQEVTGNTINVDDALSSYDADQDGGLSGAELLQMLSDNGFTPPEMKEGEESGIKPPPPSFETAIAAYNENSGNDQISQLIDILQSNSTSESNASNATYASIDITS